MTETLMNEGRPAEILLVEDNDNDVELTRVGFERARFRVNLHHVANGEKCLAFLRKEGEFAEKPRPDLVLLDLNLPAMDGTEVLEEINRDGRFHDVPFVVLTSSKAEQDVLKSYKLRCRSYLVKPITFDGFATMIRALGDYWFTLVVLPPHER